MLGLSVVKAERDIALKARDGWPLIILRYSRKACTNNAVSIFQGGIQLIVIGAADLLEDLPAKGTGRGLFSSQSEPGGVPCALLEATLPWMFLSNSEMEDGRERACVAVDGPEGVEAAVNPLALPWVALRFVDCLESFEVAVTLLSRPWDQGELRFVDSFEGVEVSETLLACRWVQTEGEVGFVGSLSGVEVAVTLFAWLWVQTEGELEFVDSWEGVEAAVTPLALPWVALRSVDFLESVEVAVTPLAWPLVRRALGFAAFLEGVEGFLGGVGVAVSPLAWSWVALRLVSAPLLGSSCVRRASSVSLATAPSSANLVISWALLRWA